MSTDSESTEEARVEYAAAQDAYLHYDNFSWQVGSVLVAGAFVFWGFLLEAQAGLVLLGANLMVCLLMSAWLLYSAHNREIYLYKLHRIRELEGQLKMQQHLRFVPGSDEKKVYTSYGPSGHSLNLFIFSVVSLGGPALVGLANPTICLSWLSMAVNAFVVAFVLTWVIRLGRSVKERISDLEKPSNTQVV